MEVSWLRTPHEIWSMIILMCDLKAIIHLSETNKLMFRWCKDPWIWLKLLDLHYPDLHGPRRISHQTINKTSNTNYYAIPILKQRKLPFIACQYPLETFKIKYALSEATASLRQQNEKKRGGNLAATIFFIARVVRNVMHWMVWGGAMIALILVASLVWLLSSSVQWLPAVNRKSQLTRIRRNLQITSKHQITQLSHYVTSERRSYRQQDSLSTLSICVVLECVLWMLEIITVGRW